MTKAVRIENADTSTYKVVVETWLKGGEGTPDTMFKEEVLSHPTALTTGLIHSHQYIVIKETT